MKRDVVNNAATGAVLVATVSAALTISIAQPLAAQRFDPRETFAPFAYPQPVNSYRAWNGHPGPEYWQNRADYKIEARLDPVKKRLDGSVVIHYTNNSPDALPYLWLQLDQNLYRSDARGAFSAGGTPSADQRTQGFEITSVAAVSGARSTRLQYRESDTRMRVELAQPVRAKGGVVDVRIDYAYEIPGEWGGRTDWYQATDGPVFEMAQWYPRMAVYDDLRGWDTQPFLNSEFYLEYGSFDYAVTLPADMIVVGSGDLVNASEVLDREQLARLQRARSSDATVMIRSAEDVAREVAKPAATGSKTWRFHMDSTRDVAFGASSAYVWDAARINLPGARTAIAMSAYPVESVGGWERSTEYVKATVEEFSRWYPYPWPAAVAEAGVAGGMEYPGIVFDSWRSSGMGLYGLTAHETGHAWYPMIVGSNERRDAWMDEGFNVFADVLAADRFNNGEFAPKRDGEYAPRKGNPADEILPLLADANAPAIMTIADAVSEQYRHPVTYFKAALGLVLLREQILGPERFDEAFTEYTHAWAFKHPAPSDFFRSIESASGEDLGWYWRGWFENNWQLDMAVTGIRQAGEAPAGAAQGRRRGAVDQRAQVTIANLDKLVMPSELDIEYASGRHERIHVPVETWQQHTIFIISVEGKERIVAATLDPDHVLPDSNRDNNRFTAN